MIYANGEKLTTDKDLNLFVKNEAKANLFPQDINSFLNAEAFRKNINPKYQNCIYLEKGKKYVIHASSNATFVADTKLKADKDPNEVNILIGRYQTFWENIFPDREFIFNYDSGFVVFAGQMGVHGNPNNVYVNNLNIQEVTVRLDDITNLQSQIDSLKKQIGGVKPSYRLYYTTSLKEVA